MKSRPTIKDIAREVGVSATTVSYVMNRNKIHKVSPATRDAILDAAKRLQYVPNGAARSLRYNSSRCISVALEKSVTLTRFSALLQGIRNGLQKEGYWLMLFDFGGKNTLYPDYLDSVLQRRADGIIYISSDGSDPDPQWRHVIQSNGLPFVACDCCPPEESLASVSFDYERGAFELACRLFGEGAKRLLYWRPSAATPQEEYRERGLQRAVELYPDAELSISMLPYDAVGPVLYQERYAAFSHICRQHLSEAILPHISAFGPNDAIICSWGIMVQHLASMLNRSSKMIKLASLSEAEMPVMSGARVLASRPGFLHGGETCAHLLLQQIRGEQLETNRVLIAPETPQYIEL